jgi:hypothetical protein
MKLKVKRANVWAATIEDKPGGLANKLEALTKAGTNLEFVLARRTPERTPGQGVVFLSPLNTDAEVKKAVAAGFTETNTLHSLRVEGRDAPGIGAKMTRALASADINLRGLSATSVGARFVAYFAFDTASDAAKATEVIEQL